jgi:hypothetical protein
MTRKLLFSVLLVLTLLFVAACGGSAPAAPNDPSATPSGGTEVKPAASKPTTAAEADEAAAPTAEPAAVPEGQTRDIENISGSLDGLKSYRLRFTFTFDGKDDQGKPQKGGMEWLQEAIKDSKDQHIRFSSTGDAQDNSKKGAFEFYQVGGMSYIYSPEAEAAQKCIGMTSDQGSQNSNSLFNPSDIVGGLKQAKLINKGETVNGVVTNHYTFDQHAVTFGAFATAKGDVWLAQDGEFLVKYVGSATGKDGILSGKSAEGTFTWEYNVEDANQLTSIALPKECEGQKPATDIPVPQNATEKASFGKVVTFKSPDAPADIAAFYKKEMPGQGWAAGEANAMGDLQTLQFSKENRKLSVTITKEEQGGSNVMINEEPGA